MNTLNDPIIVEQVFNNSLKTVWDAITKLEQMIGWFFEDIESFKPEVGFKTQFNVNTGERDFLHLWEITEVDPQKKIVYNWKYKEYPGDSFVIFELFEQENGTMLRLIHTVTESFPQDIPEFTGDSCLGGWTYFIQNRLKNYLENISN
ncbi:MAG: SRPBCC domain-containing protein [Calditrichaeota bacterium]|nr:MAG: SRPBCC domain-containing protein [Calditrichota bacterium]MBL1206122.1 SRPBCC domain-containing protein [Calditrichota bacterium]NOG45947.1 SRPBCC domain-containing protein [Calditrichota bacterium]